MKYWLWIISLNFFWCNCSIEGMAQTFPLQLELDQNLTLKPSTKSQNLKNEKWYLKKGKNQVLLQHSRYDLKGRLIYVIHYDFDSLTNKTKLHDSIVYHYPKDVKGEPDLQKDYYLSQDNKWELSKREFQIRKDDSLFLKAFTVKGEINLKFSLDENGQPLNGNGIVNLKQLEERDYYNFNFKNLLRYKALFYPVYETIIYHSEPIEQWHGDGHSGMQNRKPYYTHHSMEFVPGFKITFRQKNTNTGKPLKQTINNFASIYKGHADLTHETFFKYKKNKDLEYRIEMVVRNSYQTVATYGRNYYPPVLAFFKFIEQQKSSYVTEQRIYPLKRTNKVWPSLENISGNPVYNLNLEKVKFRSLGKPIIIIKEYSFYDN